MDYPIVTSVQTVAEDFVTVILNQARHKVGERLSLIELASSKYNLRRVTVLDFTSYWQKEDLAIQGEKVIQLLIEKSWRLNEHVLYLINYLGSSEDECTLYFYYELTFRLEGHYSEQDAKYAVVPIEWVYEVLAAKVKMYKMIERINTF